MGLPYVDKQDPWSSHSIISQWLQALPAGARVLDIGTASGTTARLCAKHGLVFYGVEVDPEFARFAAPYYQELLCVPVEQIDDDYLKGANAVVCGDVLEHLQDPAKVLKRLVDLQDDQAIFLISVPNVANLWIRLGLLFGRFNYRERGILDRTHLRFFTRSSFLDLLNISCLTPLEIRATPVPLNLVHPFFNVTIVGRLFHRILAGLTDLFPTLMGYQFVIKATKKQAKERYNGPG